MTLHTLTIGMGSVSIEPNYLDVLRLIKYIDIIFFLWYYVIRKKRKEFLKMGEVIGAIIIWGIFVYIIARG
jgi:hypothetical protein